MLPSWSDSLPIVPAPKGFIESSSLVPALRQQALLGHPARTRLIGVYLLPDELADILRSNSIRHTIICRAYVNDELVSLDAAKSFFRRMVASAKAEQSRKFDLTDPDQKRIIQRYTDATKQRQGQSIDMTGATFLGSLMEADDIYAFSVIVTNSIQTDRGQTAVPTQRGGSLDTPRQSDC
jgi:hypothetical protein